MHHLMSSFIFLWREQSIRKAYHLFMTLACDFTDCYPSFKTTLRNFIKDNTALQVGTRNYDTLFVMFKCLILEHLKAVHIVSPILVVIDALNESGGTNNGTGQHTFYAKNLIRLASNFHVVISSRPGRLCCFLVMLKLLTCAWLAHAWLAYPAFWSHVLISSTVKMIL